MARLLPHLTQELENELLRAVEASNDGYPHHLRDMQVAYESITEQDIDTVSDAIASQSEVELGTHSPLDLEELHERENYPFAGDVASTTANVQVGDSVRHANSGRLVRITEIVRDGLYRGVMQAFRSNGTEVEARTVTLQSSEIVAADDALAVACASLADANEAAQAARRTFEQTFLSIVEEVLAEGRDRSSLKCLRDLRARLNEDLFESSPNDLGVEFIAWIKADRAHKVASEKFLRAAHEVSRASRAIE